MAILEGTTENGALVPVQVTDEGRVVAEGLQGPEGPQGPQGEKGDKGDQGDPGSPGNLWSGSDPGPISYGGGSVGIGTDAPSQLLHIRAVSATAGIRLDSAEGTGRQYEIRSLTNGVLAIGTTTQNIINIGTNNVGIGTTSPQAQLDVRGSSTGDAKIRLDETGSFQAALQLRGNDLEIRGSSGAIEFFSGNADEASSTEIASFDAAGRLLVGLTTAPAGTLAGDVVCQGAFVLQSPDGMWWAIEVANDGTLFASQASIR